MNEMQVEAHNRILMWAEVGNHLQVAIESLNRAQGVLEDLGAPLIDGRLAEAIETIATFCEK
jgi:hypothetical protein